MKQPRALLVPLLAAVLGMAACQDSGTQDQPASSVTLTTTSGGKAPAAKAEWREATIEEAAALHKAGAAFFDANNERFREKHGIVPGATLLASSARYDVAATLPKDKEADLVFYCSSRT